MHSLSIEEFHQLQQDGDDYVLLDVREPNEYEICNLGGKLIPMNQVAERLAELDKSQHIIVHCKLGGRSLAVAEFLKTQGYEKVSNLSGGIIAWIDKYDSSMKKY